jgi:hypothetical protein
MLKLNPDQLRQPHGGHHYLIPNGPAVKGESFKEVVQKIKDYRINNGIPVGDPEQDVLWFYALHWPYMVEPDVQRKAPEESEMFRSWAKWVRKAWKTPPKKTITTKEASIRWDVCLTCPHNKKFNWRETDESTAIQQRVFLLRRGVEVPEGIGYCACHKADLSALSFIDGPQSFSDKSKEFIQPEACWVK